MTHQSSGPRQPPHTGSTRAVPLAAPTARMTFEATAIAEPPPDDLPPDDLLLAASIGQALKLILDTFPEGTLAGDWVELKIGSTYGAKAYITESGAALRAEMLLPATETGTAGTYPLQYRMNWMSGESSMSPVQTYTIDDTPPGGARLAPLAPQSALADGLDFSQFPDGIPFSLYGYEGMAPGDLIDMYVDGAKQRGTHRVPFPLPDNTTPLEVMLTMDPVPADGVHTFAYGVTDRPKHSLVMSETVSIRTIATGLTTSPKAPLIPGAPDATDDLIDFRDAHASSGAGADVEIPWHAETKAGDTVVVHWNERRIGPLRIANTSDADKPSAVVRVPYGDIFAAWHAVSNGEDMAVSTAVSYDIFRAGVLAGTSPPVDIFTNLVAAGGGGIEDPDPETPGHEALIAPEVRSANDDVNDIPADQYKLAAVVRIPRTTTVETGEKTLLEDDDIIHITFGPNTLAPVTYKLADDADSTEDYFEVPLPADKIAGAAGVVEAYYEIERSIDGGKGFVLSPSASVTVSNPDDAPGGSTRPAAVAWTNQKSAKEGLAILPDATVSVKLEVPLYTNKSAGDEITLQANFFRGQDLDDDATQIRRVTYVYAVPQREAATTSTLTLTWDDLIPDKVAFPGLEYQMHAHIGYTISNVQGATSMASDEFTLLVDTRYADDWISGNTLLSSRE